MHSLSPAAPHLCLAPLQLVGHCQSPSPLLRTAAARSSAAPPRPPTGYTAASSCPAPAWPPGTLPAAPRTCRSRCAPASPACPTPPPTCMFKGRTTIGYTKHKDPMLSLRRHPAHLSQLRHTPHGPLSFPHPPATPPSPLSCPPLVTLTSGAAGPAAPSTPAAPWTSPPRAPPPGRRGSASPGRPSSAAAWAPDAPPRRATARRPRCAPLGWRAPPGPGPGLRRSRVTQFMTRVKSSQPRADRGDVCQPSHPHACAPSRRPMQPTSDAKG